MFMQARTSNHSRTDDDNYAVGRTTALQDPTTGLYFCSPTNTFTHGWAARVMRSFGSVTPTNTLIFLAFPFTGVRRLLQPLPVSLQPSPVLRDVRISPYHFSALQATTTTIAPPSPTEVIHTALPRAFKSEAGTT